MKCELCKTKIQEIFLKKMVGTTIKDEKGKKHYVCHECQTKFDNDKTKMLAEL